MARGGQRRVVELIARPAPSAVVHRFESREASATVILDGLETPVLATGVDGVVTYANHAARQMLGPDLIKKRFARLVAFRDELDGGAVEDPVSECLDQGCAVRRTCAARARRPSAVEFVVDVVATPVMGEGTMTGVVVELRNISRTRTLLRMLEHEATHDALTSLTNREAFKHHLAHVVARLRGDDVHALLFLDLDRFKPVNDVCGHAAGDAALQEVAEVFRKVVRRRDMLARIGGDEFALLLEHCPERRAVRVAHKLRAALRQRPFRWGEHSFALDVSIGVVVFGLPQQDPEKILVAADQACYAVKRRRRPSAKRTTRRGGSSSAPQATAAD